jgi:sulfur carrier protein
LHLIEFASHCAGRYHFPMLIKVNGDAREFPDGTTLRAVVVSFKLTPEKVAIELNRRLVRSDKYDTPLKNGDEIEIVTFVGGG